MLQTVETPNHLQRINLLKNGVRTFGFLESIPANCDDDSSKQLLTIRAIHSNGKLFTTTLESYLPVNERHRFQPGLPIGIIYHPTQPTVAIVDPFVDKVKLQNAINQYYAQFDHNALTLAQQQLLRNKGMKTLAIITDLQQTGRQHGEHREIQMTISFQNNSTTNRTMTRTFFIHKSTLSQWQIGRFIRIEIDPTGSELFNIDQPMIIGNTTDHSLTIR